MMGQHDRSEALFYYFRLEDQVPENYLVDNPSCVIVGVQATAARMSQETVGPSPDPHPSASAIHGRELFTNIASEFSSCTMGAQMI